MTESTPAAPVTEPEAQTPPAGTETPDPAQPTETGEPKPGSEAAKYRTRLREAETQRDALAERVAKLRTAEVERVAAGHLAQPGDLLAYSGAGLDDLLEEDGSVSEGLVLTALAGLLESRPGLRKTAPPRRGPNTAWQGKQPGSLSGPSWAEVLRGK